MIKCVGVALVAARVLTFQMASESQADHNFPDASLSVTFDGKIFEMDGFSASWSPTRFPRPNKPSSQGAKGHLGRRYSAFSRRCQSHVRPALYIFPQSIGTSGHPSSSHYFVGYQVDSLVYLKSRHSRSTIPSSDPAHIQLRPPGDITQRSQLRAHTEEHLADHQQVDGGDK